VIWRIFRKSSRPSGEVSSWWREAEALAALPSAEGLERLRSARTPPDRSLDEAEQQEEMLDGLEHLVRLASEARLPVLVTQHRAVGQDQCHAVIPATLGGPANASGKLFLTSRRLVFTGAGLSAWPWHRISRVDRQGRTLVILTGEEEATVLQCNSYGDALAAAHMAARLRRPAKGDAGGNGRR